MHVTNLTLSKAKIVLATTLTLLCSVAQSDQHGLKAYEMDDFQAAERGYDQTPPIGFVAIDEDGYVADSNTRLMMSKIDDFDELNIIEMRSRQSTRMHFNYKSSLSDSALSATLQILGKLKIEQEPDFQSEFLDVVDSEESQDNATSDTDYSLSFNLPSGQIVLENGTISILNSSGFSQLNAADRHTDKLENLHFLMMLRNTMSGTDLPQFNLAMEEAISENTLLPGASSREPRYKGPESNIQGGWACAGALIALAAANAALAASIAATYATLGLAAATIAGAVSAVGGAIIAVDMACMEM
jgi:hypothetical protein